MSKRIGELLSAENPHIWCQVYKKKVFLLGLLDILINVGGHRKLGSSRTENEVTGNSRENEEERTNKTF